VGLVYDGSNLLLRFRAPYSVGWVQVHVQTNATGGMTYTSATSVSSTLVDCRANRLQDQTIAVTAGLRYAIFLVPVQYDGAGTKVMYNGEGGRPDAVASVTTWVGLPTAHNLLSASHGDSTAASAVRGDIATAQGASPNTKWARYALGGAATYLRSDGTDALWAAVAAADLTGTTLPASIVTSSLTAVGALNAGSITSGFGAIDIGADPLTCGPATATSLTLKSRVVTGTDSVVATDFLVVCNSVGAFTLTMPTAVVGQLFHIKNIGAGTVTLEGAGGDTIDGDLNQTLYQWDGVVISCQAANTWVVT